VIGSLPPGGIGPRSDRSTEKRILAPELKVARSGTAHNPVMSILTSLEVPGTKVARVKYDSPPPPPHK